MQRKEEKKAPSKSSHAGRGKETTGKTKDSISTVSYLYEPGHHDDNMPMTRTMDNTYQLRPTESQQFPVCAVTNILKDVLTTNLQLEKYEAEWSRQMVMTLCEVIKARVKDLMIPRHKIVVWVTIGQLTSQSIQMSSSFLWDPFTDNHASFSFKNCSLFSVAKVYGIYYE